jgi:hypothetical protein
MYIFWIPLLCAWVIPVVTAGQHHDSRSYVTELAAILGSVAIIGTLIFGVVLGTKRWWGYLGWATLFGLCILGLVIFVAFENSVPLNAPDDQGVGLGAMLVTALLSPAVALPLWFGGSLGGLVNVLKRRKQDRRRLVRP